jgi:hypothetical protein
MSETLVTNTTSRDNDIESALSRDSACPECARRRALDAERQRRRRARLPSSPQPPVAVQAAQAAQVQTAQSSQPPATQPPPRPRVITVKRPGVAATGADEITHEQWESLGRDTARLRAFLHQRSLGGQNG